jgi:hypothetical protein
MRLSQFCDLLDLAFTEQARRPDLPEPEALPADNLDPDRFCKACRLLDPGVD